MDGDRLRDDGRALRRGHLCSGSRELNEQTSARAAAISGLDEETARIIETTLDAAEEKVAVDPVVLDVHAFVDAFDALIIAAGRNDRHVRSIVDEIERLVALDVGLKPLRVEGVSGGAWVAIDYGSVIVHVFDEANRDYYDLEHLWNAAPAYRRPQRLTSDS